MEFEEVTVTLEPFAFGEGESLGGFDEEKEGDE